MSSWHVPDEALIRFVTEPRSLDEVTASSIETHIVHCGQCRAVTATAVDADALESNWHSLAEAVDHPRVSLLERVLGRFLPETTARLLAATPALQTAWAAAVLAVGVVAVVLAHNAHSDLPLVILAPLVPLGGVALAFAPTSDPAGEAGLATPAQGAGVVVLRTLAVLATVIPILTAASVFAPVVDLRAIAWLLPALGTTAVAIALSTWLVPATATLTTGVGWAALVLTVGYVGRTDLPDFNEAPFFGWTMQLVALFVLLAATAVSVRRRDRFTVLEAR
jgi:hypothetical protein